MNLQQKSIEETGWYNLTINQNMNSDDALTYWGLPQANTLDYVDPIIYYLREDAQPLPVNEPDINNNNNWEQIDLNNSTMLSKYNSYWIRITQIYEEPPSPEPEPEPEPTPEPEPEPEPFIYVMSGTAELHTAVTAWCADSAAAEEIYGHISDWDTSEVTDMTLLFYSGTAVRPPNNESYAVPGAENFNEDISRWDTGKVTMMLFMFRENSVFNQDISKWDIGNVENMGYMFYKASAFDCDIGGWEVGHVTNLASMFKEATTFNQDIGGWNVTSSSNLSSMFKNASSFNQDLNSWETGHVTAMYHMFYYATSFNQTLAWDLGAIVNTEDIDTIFEGSPGSFV